jgi:uncharacterized Zn finger protein
MYYGDYPPYVSAAEKRKRAADAVKKLAKKGHPVRPVKIEGRIIASTFWGAAWCENLEAYSDYENRLPRGRTYVRNGSVVDLQISAGRVQAKVSGSELYEIDIRIGRLDSKSWKALIRESAGGIGSMIELLQGKFSKDVMAVLARPKTGLFPMPSQIELSCSCPDWAGMCKHVAAALYGVGARLDQEPELLFVLRQVDQTELLSEATRARKLGRPSRKKTIATGDLSALFGIELDGEPAPKKRKK